MNFDSFELHPAIMAGIRATGYEEPTPIQVKAIPPILEGHDLIGLAQTGTGKTAAFVLPIMHRLIGKSRGHVLAAVVAPTRELAEQTCQAFNELGKKTGLRTIAVYGGMSMDQQVRALRNGVEIVVGCPGRMLDHLWKGTLDFTRLEVLVIDEADRMFDMGFLPSIRDILQCILQPRQTLLFSATMPDAIRGLVREILTNPITVQIGQTMPATTVSHALYPVPDHLKTGLLKEILRTTATDSVLVFTRTKHRAQRLSQQLLNAGFDVTALQGDMSQPQRQAAFRGFQNGSFKILVATDIAARGIDVLSISHVINFDMPDDTDSYIHRIGRTGRINQEGSAFTLVTAKDSLLIRDLEHLLNAKLERRTLEGFDYAAAAPPRPAGSAYGRGPRRGPTSGPTRSRKPAFSR
jgi:ATP-dependent RNA helicase RhlE